MTGLSTIVFINVMFVLEVVLSFLVPSSSGLAVLTMPIMAPLADFANVGRELVVTAYQSASGLVNLVTPTSAVVMGAGHCQGALCALAEVGGPAARHADRADRALPEPGRRAGMNADRHRDNNGAWGSRFVAGKAGRPASPVAWLLAARATKSDPGSPSGIQQGSAGVFQGAHHGGVSLAGSADVARGDQYHVVAGHGPQDFGIGVAIQQASHHGSGPGVVCTSTICWLWTTARTMSWMARVLPAGSSCSSTRV